MNSPKIYQSPTWDELIFENRNQSYGAYVLRKYSNQRILIGFFVTITFIVSIILMIGKFTQTTKEIFKISSEEHILKQKEIIYEIQNKEEVKSSGNKSKSTSSSSSSKKQLENNYSVSSIVDTEKKEISDTAGTSVGIDNQKGKNLGGTGIGNDLDTSSINNLGKGNNLNTSNVVDIPEFFPEFPGGESKMFDFLGRNLKFPTNYDGYRKTTTVYISFVVNAQGNIEDIKIERSGGYEFDQEAMKAIKKMPKWTPGKMGDRAVSVRFRLPIKFTYRN